MVAVNKSLMKGQLTVVSIATPLTWLMKIIFVVGLILFDSSISLRTVSVTVPIKTEINQSSTNYASRTLFFKAAHTGLTCSSFLAFQVVKGFVACVFHYDTVVRMKVKIARAEVPAQNVHCLIFQAYHFVVNNSSESHSATQPNG